MRIFKKFTFDSAHFLPNVPDGHQCKNIHGHTYRMTIFFDGSMEEHLEWVLDFAEIKKVVKPIVDHLDHQLLNELEGLENPTCEKIAVWIWDHVKPKLPQLARIELNETVSSGVIYEGN